jgi:adenine phosphoribosyltransferase
MKRNMQQVKKSIQQYLKKSIRNIPDFPQKGIQFKDITTLLKDPDALNLVSWLLKQAFLNKSIDYVAGIESRGFLFGPRLAQDLNAGFIPIRKPGKLPAKTVSGQYELEYASDTLEMHVDAVQPGDKILIHDDLLATGGSAVTAAELVQKLDGAVAGFSFITELEELDGRNQLPENTIVDVLISL